MARLIRNARRFDGVSTDGSDWKNNCIQPAGELPVQYHQVRVTSHDPGQSTFICPFLESSNPPTIASSSAPLPPAGNPNISYLLDTSVVSLDSCYLTCYQETPAQNPVIGIHFVLSARTTSGFVERSASIPFDTSVTVRNKD